MILGSATEIGASLIAMATHGRSGLARLHFGSVTEKVLRASALPLLVVRSADDEVAPEVRRRAALRRILLAVDRRELSLQALGPAREFALLFDAEILLLHVLEQLAAPVPELEHALLSACADRDIDLVAMATRGRAGLPRLFMGSVAERALRQSTVPTRLVRPGPGAIDRVHESEQHRAP